jgi:CheY-like chemotaxis protein
VTKKWILIAEDDRMDLDLTVRALQSYASTYDIVEAADGTEVLEYLQTRAQIQGPPSVVLMDLKMPKLDGLETLERIKAVECLKCIPVVMLTSSRHPSDVSRCYRLGANGYLVKPMGFKPYSDCLQTLARFWLDVNEPPPFFRSERS